jgi:16S rRNA processing protein RimM
VDTPLEDVMLVVGRIVGTHGVRGEVKMDIYSDRPEEIPKLRRIYLNDDPTPRPIQRPRGSERQAILKITGVDTREEAEALRGTIVRIKGNQLSPREDDSYYHYQLVGLHVFLEDGTHIGSLAEVLETGEVDVYVVRDDAGREQLFPALKDVVLDIDPSAGKMVVRPLMYEDA